MRIETFIIDALGDASHVVIDGASAAVIDPQRDVRPYIEAAKRTGATIDFVFETHVHNDYLSGGRELAALGARVVAPAAANLAFPHLGLNDGDEIQVGGATLRALASPGHTYEHTAYLAGSGGGPEAAFTGGSLLMGSAGRSDLLGPDHTDSLTRAQWNSIRRIASVLEPGAMIYPTHGAGSFCSSSASITDRFGALRTEQGRNPALALASYELFREAHLQPAPTPAYYRYMAPINREGPKVFGTPPSVAHLDPGTATAHIEAGATAVDIRPIRDFASGHLRNSLSIEHGSSFLAYVGWFVPFNAPLVLVAGSVEHARLATLDLFRIGYERVEGVVLASDIPAAQIDRFEPASVDEAEAALASRERPVIDVRFAHEQEASPLPGAIAAPIDRFADSNEAFPNDAIVICEAGYRATIAASFLRKRGLGAVPVLGTGITELQRRATVPA